ncbi:MAG: hypothetical protein M3P12_08570, partial [Gemmatimonadota bacterium]|nr:hypothetical protein [Gemmatimonadota bacterium]
FFGSADWMPRNFDRRVEVVTPVEDRNLHPRIFALLESCLADNRQAWDLASDGSYFQRKPGRRPVISTHERLLGNSWGLDPLPPSGENGAAELHSGQLPRAQSAAPTSSS